MSDLDNIANSILDTIKGNNANVQTAAEFLDTVHTEFLDTAHAVGTIRDDVGALVYAKIEISNNNPKIYVDVLNNIISVSQGENRTQLSYDLEDDVIGLSSYIEWYY